MGAPGDQPGGRSTEAKIGRKRNEPKALDAYRRKRSVERTTEPAGGAVDRPSSAAAGLARLFVVQKHSARHLHYDLRLELGGVLLSWAVPRGPSPDPQDKRLAVHVEDHPVEYAEFEGLIPEGNYGAGAVIVFDRGRWISIGDPAEGLRSGKLLFDLWGYKLRGRWTLFRTKDGPKNWLLVKKPDAWAARGAELGEESIYSGLRVDELREGAEPARALRQKLARRRVPRGELAATDVEPMLAQIEEAPFSRPGWVFEIKYDGYRLIVGRAGDRPYLRYRRGQEVTELFPEIATAIRHLPFSGVVIDGELVVLDAQSRPSFQSLQQRVHLKRPQEIAAAAVRLPATFFAFDLLACEGFDLRSLPLVERKQFLRQLLPPAGPLAYSEHFDERGRELYEEVCRLGFEGIVAKRADAPYQAGRSASWLKIRADRTGDFAIVGFTLPRGARAGIGALQLAVREGPGLVWCGRVGTGFDTRLLDELHARLERDRRASPPCSGETPEGPENVWVEPRLVAEVRYKEWTRAGTLRHPVFLRLRDDKEPEDCERREPAPAAPAPAEAAAVVPAATAAHTVAFTNLGKTFWPAEGYTKGDLVEYYRAVSPWLLPYLQDRPVVLTRYPDGIAGKSFYQKDAPGFVPEWVRTETLWSEHAQREIHYFVVEDEASLLYLVNLGTIPLHLWSSRTRSLGSPDWCILDLDPKGAPFAHVVRVARSIRRLTEELELDCYVKTSGSTGLHVLLPLGGLCTYEQSRQLGELLSRVVVAELPEIATLARPIGAREGRVYLDYLQNGHGRLLVAPFSVRPLAGAPVSTPLRWSEVGPRLEIGKFTLRSVPPRLARQRIDPWKGLLGATPDLARALERLERRLVR